MTSLSLLEVSSPLTLGKKTAAELMTANPVSIRHDATILEAVDLFTRRGISAAPVIDEAGRPLGVLSRTDILIHNREFVGAFAPSEYAGTTSSQVRDLMTPVVFCVSPQAPVSRVVHEMVSLKVHHLFVVEENGTLVGVISVLDVLRGLVPKTRAEGGAQPSSGTDR